MDRHQPVRRWMKDSETEHCLACRTDFSPLVRKHHCRRCGGIFCDSCSARKLLIPRDQILYPPEDVTAFMPLDQDPSEPQRVCDSCAAAIQPFQEQLKLQMAKANQETILDRASSERYLNLPVQFGLDQEIRKATYILYNFTRDNAIEGEDTIPRELLWGAKGIAFLTIIKAGFFFTGRVGTGLVVSRLPDGSWSAPSAICCTGVGWGFQIGGEITDVVIVLNTDAAVDAFASSTQLSLGTELGISLGPVGRSAGTDLHAGDRGVTAAFSYAHSKGFFIGVSLEASVIVARQDVNTAFYGESVTSSRLLRGDYPRPRAAEPLYKAITEVMAFAGPYPDLPSRPVAPAQAAAATTTRDGHHVVPPANDEWSRVRQQRLSRGDSAAFVPMEELKDMRPNPSGEKPTFVIHDEDERHPTSDDDGEMQSVRF